MNARMLIPSKYFTAAAFTDQITVTIEVVDFTEVEVEGKNGKPPTTETKGSIMLKEFPGKPWLCNVTNTKCLIAMFGEEDAEKRWPTKRVTVYAERVMSFGEWVLGVRIKGSPDITAPVSVRLKLKKKKEQVLTMMPTGGNGHAKAAPKPAAPIVTVTFGKEQGWKDKPIASFTSAQLEEVIKHGENMCAATPAAPWVKGVQACIAAIRSNLEQRVTAPPPDAAQEEVEAP